MVQWVVLFKGKHSPLLEEVFLRIVLSWGKDQMARGLGGSREISTLWAPDLLPPFKDWGPGPSHYMDSDKQPAGAGLLSHFFCSKSCFSGI